MIDYHILVITSDGVILDILKYVEYLDLFRFRLVSRVFNNAVMKTWVNYDINTIDIRNYHKVKSLSMLNVLYKNKSFNPAINNNIIIYNVCKKDYIDVFKELLKDKRVNISGRDCMYKTLRYNSVKIFKEMINIKHIVTTTDISDLLIKAVRYNSQAIVIMILEKYDINLNTLNTCIFIVCYNLGSPTMLNHLLSTKKQILLVDGFARNAVDGKNFDLIPILLSKNLISIDVIHNYCIVPICLYGRLDVIKTLVTDKRIDITYNNNAAIKTAISQFHIKIVAYLWSIPAVRKSLEKIDYVLYSNLNTYMK